MACCILHRENYSPSITSEQHAKVKNSKHFELCKGYSVSQSTSGTLISGATIYTAEDHQPFIENGWVAYEAGTIVDIGSNSKTPPYCQNTIDAHGKLLLPGFVNPHWHESFAAPNNEMPDDSDTQPSPYSRGGDISALGKLFGFIASVQDQLTPNEALAIARWSLWTQLRSGTTTLADLGSANTADAMSQAAIDLGMRLYVSRWCSDIMIPATGSHYREIGDTEKQIDDVATLMSKWHTHTSGLINGIPTVMGTFGSSDRQLKAIKCIADDYNAPYAMHLGALENEDAAIRRVFNCSSIQRAANLGLLNHRLMAVHTAFGSDNEFKALRDAKVKLCMAPGHYGMLGENTLCKTARISNLIQQKEPVACSTDGDINYTGGMTEAMRAMHLRLNEMANDNSCCPPITALKSGTCYAAQALSQQKLGRIHRGACADFVLINTTDWRYKKSRHPLKTHLLTGSSKDIDTVIIAGETVVSDGVSTRFDEQQLWQDYVSAAASAHMRIKPG